MRKSQIKRKKRRDDDDVIMLEGHTGRPSVGVEKAKREKDSRAIVMLDD